MRIAMGCDHAGYPLKEDLKVYLVEEGHEVLDFGTDSTEPVDYPDFCATAARAVVEGRAVRGVVLGATGEGEAMVANKIHGVRAAVCNDLFTARMSRAHNDANILAIGARVVAAALAKEILRVWLVTPFDGGRHLRRVERISEIERGEA